MGRYSTEEKKANFKKLAGNRTNQVLERLRILSNCSNRQLYEYSEDDVRRVFKAIEDEINIVKARFNKKKRNKFNWE